MKIVVAVCVYNRYDNIKKWVNAWKQRSETRYVSSLEKTVWVDDKEMPMVEITSDAETELAIIHNDNGDKRIFEVIRAEIIKNPGKSGLHYFQRQNIGFDMGCVQDIFKERLPGFPNDWDYLLWCADDTIPVRKDFIKQYLDTIQQPFCGCACMKISKHQSIHVRTSGWMVNKQVSKMLTFPADPITTKNECYLFEHRGGKKTLVSQIREMGLDVRQVAPDDTAPLWDSGYWRRLNRANEYYEAFAPLDKRSGDKITFICTIYEQYPAIVSSLIAQTHTNWELLLIHDGPSERMYPEASVDPRIKFIETPERKENYGHPIRQWALQNLDELSNGDYVVITNADNYYVPVFNEYMLRAFEKYHTAVASYCLEMVHSYKAWQTIPVKFQKGYIDCGGVMVKREIAQEVGWKDFSHSADWTYFNDIAARYNLKSFIPVKGCLLIHN